MVVTAIDRSKADWQQRCILTDNIDKIFTRSVTLCNLDLLEYLVQIAKVYNET
ncbi:hypothetical protein BIWAKO_05816 [Bosea sp. BIWAKO-01]|nr:hypothetical protein BIWAKO_05816 [Bosea sp. BIWAKO-01]